MLSWMRSDALCTRMAMHADAQAIDFSGLLMLLKMHGRCIFSTLFAGVSTVLSTARAPVQAPAPLPSLVSLAAASPGVASELLDCPLQNANERLPCACIQQEVCQLMKLALPAAHLHADSC
jgi:hypothetical protein